MLDQLISESEKYDLNKIDFVAPARTFTWDTAGRLVPPADMFTYPSLEPNEHALRQVCAKLAPAVFGKGSNKALPYDYLTAMPRSLMATVLNDHQLNANGNPWMVRGYQQVCRAVLSDNYAGGRSQFGDYENTAYLKVVDQLLQGSAAQFPQLHVTRDSQVSVDHLNARLLWRDLKGPDGRYGIGAYIGNGEVGDRKLKVLSLIKRHSCDNSIIINRDEESFEIFHRGSFAAIRTQFKAAISKVLSVTGELVEALFKAEEDEIPDFGAVLGGLALQYGWDDDTRGAVTLGTEGRETRAGIIHGVTYAAHVTDLGPNDQADMEILGGSLLFAGQDLFSRAARQYRQKMAGIETR